MNRRLFLIDIENVIGTAFFDQGAACRGREQVAAAAGLRDEEHAVVGVTSVQGVLPAAEAFPGKTIRVQLGQDGAERAILELVDVEHIAKRYASVVIASGDHAFAEFARDMRDAGTTVHVVARERSLARALADEATSVHLIG